MSEEPWEAVPHGLCWESESRVFATDLEFGIHPLLNLRRSTGLLSLLMFVGSHSIHSISFKSNAWNVRSSAQPAVPLSEGATAQPAVAAYQWPDSIFQSPVVVSLDVIWYDLWSFTTDGFYRNNWGFRYVCWVETKVGASCVWPARSEHFRENWWVLTLSAGKNFSHLRNHFRLQDPSKKTQYKEFTPPQVHTTRHQFANLI